MREHLMIVGVANETFPDERRVALVPSVVPSLIQADLEVVIAAEAGQASGYIDAAYQEAGARIVPSRDDVFSSADAVLQVRTLGANPVAGRADLEKLRADQVVIGFAEPLSAPEAARELAVSGVTAFAMELMPRITRAQSMDALSSMASVAGYQAVLMAAERSPRMFPMMMTAAGTIAPARVFIIGAGVAGLQAIATARRLGAVVEAYDVRPAVKEQVESLGARFVEMEIEAGDAEDKGGYAKEMDEAFLTKQRELMTQVLASSDVVITTAAVPGKTAPLLLTGEMVAGMPPGGVIVDLAAERGGNCELTQPGETVVEHAVTIFGPLNIASSTAYHASQMYAKNVATFLLHLVQDGQLQVDTGDEITRETLVCRGGEVVHPRLRELLGLAAADPAEGS